MRKLSNKFRLKYIVYYTQGRIHDLVQGGALLKIFYLVPREAWFLFSREARKILGGFAPPQNKFCPPQEHKL